MKIQCQTCGCHFSEDFPETLTPTCNFWGDYKLGNIPEDFKQKIWDWLFACPVTEMEDSIGMSLIMSFYGQPLRSEQKFESFVEGWETMSPADRKKYQKDFYKALTTKK